MELISKNAFVDLKERPKVFEANVDDYDATYKLVKKVLKTCGLPMALNDSKFVKTCWNTYFWFAFINSIIATALEFMNVLETAWGGTFLDLFRMLPCVGYLIVALSKASKIKIYSSVFENLESELREMWPNGPVTEGEHRILSQNLSQIRFHVTAYFSCNMVLGSIFILQVGIIYAKRMAGYDEPMVLPFSYWLPFDPYQDEKYVQAVIFVQTCHCFWSVVFMLAGDLLFIIYLGHITTQFALLAFRINKFVSVSIDDQLIEAYPLGVASKLEEKQNHNTSIGDEDSEKILEQELGSILQRHRALIRLSTDVENMYTFSLLVNFMNSSIGICFNLFCVAFVEKWNEINYKIFIVTSISQIWILCWYGQRLIETSTEIGDALYNCGWYALSNKLKKSILIMIHRAQKEVHITTYGFSIISLESYATILKTSWSYFTLLINIYKE